MTTPLIALVWMLCLLGSFAVDRCAGHGPMTTVLGVAILITSIVLAVIFTRAVVVPRCRTEPTTRR
ncbi:hypothetical protein GPX89_24405 [Nocardia sp. ET3-3]|uniref:Uncharacterized protein n=1 Tax=Nocardia terrae TaxID=2675851 RepID=A0A7K1V2N3_9NOCA|nr:hypothetical protein [Nocardia terrae]MVU80378.1 hypothetical protein [Nocardia terrae]